MKVKFHRNFKKQLRKLPQKVQERFYDRLELFFENQFDKTLNNHAVDSAFPGCRSINVTGDYRAIFYQELDTVLFRSIGTHSDLYG